MTDHQNPFQSETEGSDEPAPQPESARMALRVGAFAADVFCILILFFAANLIIFSLNPEIADELERYTEEMREYQERRQEANGTEEQFGPPPTPSEEARGVIQITYVVSLALVLLYFILGEILTKGASPGKLLFRLRVIRTDPGAGPGLALGATVLRSVIKAVSLALSMTLQPIMLIFLVNYFFAFFTQDRRAVHDYLARTKVISSPEASSHDIPASPQNPTA